MTDILFNDPCILFALHREAHSFLKDFPPQEEFPGAPCWARFCGPSWLSVLVLETGIGPERMARAVNWLLGEPRLGNVPYRPKTVIAAGFAGALHETLGVADIVVATEVVDPQGERWETTWPGELPPGPWHPPLHRGPIVSIANVVAAPSGKRDLARRHQAIAVDMETATLAQRCHERGIPFGSVRAISDAFDTSLSPQLVTLLAGHRVSLARVALILVRKPTLGAELWRLGRDTRRAGKQLARALGELLTLTLSWAGDAE